MKSIICGIIFLSFLVATHLSEVESDDARNKQALEENNPEFAPLDKPEFDNEDIEEDVTDIEGAEDNDEDKEQNDPYGRRYRRYRRRYRSCNRRRCNRRRSYWGK